MRKQAALLFFTAIAAFAAAQPLNQSDAKGKQGKWIKKDSENKLIYEGQFKDDKPVGEFKYYYNTGAIKTVSVFSYKGKDTVVRAKHYYETGKLMGEGKYVNRKKDSAWKYYSETGKLLNEENYVMGKKNGTFKVYDDTGSVIKVENWKNDVKNGEVKEWYGLDVKKMEGMYVNGQLNGQTNYYFPDGSISAAGVFKMGVKDGVWTYGIGGGKDGCKELYKDGKLVRTQRINGQFEDVYPKTNIPMSTINYVAGLKNGPFKEYYNVGSFQKQDVPPDPENGTNAPPDVEEVLVGQKVKRQGTYKNDKLDGKIIYFKLDGTIEKTEVYKDGVLQETK